MSSDLSIALVGAGIMGKKHLKTIADTEGIRVSAICDLDLSKAQTLAEECGATALDNWEAVLRAKPDAVCLSVPHHLHFPMTMQALELGIHVIVDKPMATSIEHCRTMIQAAEKQGVYLNVLERTVFSPAHKTIGAMSSSGELGNFVTGRLQSFRSYFAKWRPKWFLDPELAGGGMFLNLGPHRLGTIRACLPHLKPEWVDAQVVTLPENKVEALTSARIGFAGGAIINLDQVGHFTVPEPWSEENFLIFEKAFVGWSGAHIVVCRADGTEETLPPPAAIDEHSPVFADLVLAAKGKPIQGPSAQDFAADIATILAIYKSGELGEKVMLDDGWRVT